MQWFKDILIWIWWHPFRRLLHRLPVAKTYGLGAMLARAVSRLPLPLFRAMARSAGTVLGPTASPRTRRRTARQGMFCFMMNEIETLIFPRLTADDMDFAAPVAGLDRLDDALARGTGVILLLSHFGANQMVMPAIGFRGYALHQVSAPATVLNDTLPEDRPPWIKRTREMRWEFERRLPVTHINGLGNTAKILQCLQQGRILAIAGDGGRFTAPVQVPFLGRLANFPAGPMLLARRTGSPVLPVFVIREPSGRNTVIIEPPVEAVHAPGQSKAEAVEAGVREFVSRLEQRVRAHPGHYLRHLAFREHMAPVDMIPFWTD
jgi:KDO2-lipid IV(A) lauroyltransferase